jgi:hypothetical protein
VSTTDDTHRPIRTVERHLPFDTARFVAVFEATAFWTGTLAPVAHVALLLDGLTGAELPVFLGLVVVNVVSLLAGRDHATA